MKTFFRNGLLLLVMGFGFMFSGQATNIDNLKGTYSILPPELRELSPLEGAVAWHTGVIRRLYDVGHMTEGEPKNKPQRAAGESEANFKVRLAAWNTSYKAWAENIPVSSIKNVVRTLFYRVPGTTSIADFKVSENTFKDLSKKEAAAKIADIVSRLWVYNYIKNEGLTPSGKLPAKFNNLKLSIDSCIEAKTIFPEYDIIRLSLLAAFWAVFGDDREALNEYFVALKVSLNKKINEAKGSYCRDIKVQLDIILDVVAAIIISDDWMGDVFGNDVVDLVSSYESVDELKDPVKYEQIIYAQLLGSYSLVDIPYARPKISIGTSNFEFPDCVETMIRNFLNHLSYDSEKKIFTIENLKKLTKKTLHENLVNFYETYANPSVAGATNAHEAWAKVISNIPWVAYNNLFAGDGCCRGSYVKVPIDSIDQVRPFLMDNNDTIINDDGASTVWELRSRYRNVIIVLNHLLNLELFKDKKMAEEFIRDDFVNAYLPKVIAPFGEVVGNLPDGEVGILTINLLELRSVGRYSYEVKFNLTQGHGQFSNKLLVAKSASVLGLISSDHLKDLPLTVLMLLPGDELVEFVSDDSIAWLTLFAQEIDNPDKILDFIDQIKHLNKSLYALMTFLNRRNLDENINKCGQLKLLAKAIASGVETDFGMPIIQAQLGIMASFPDIRYQALVLWRKLFEKGQGFMQAAVAAKEGMSCEDPDVQKIALDLWTLLVEKGQAFTEAADAATTGVMNNNFGIRGSALDLFKALVEKGQAFTAAADAASDGMLRGVPDVRWFALNLWKELFKKEQGFSVAIDAIKEGMKSRDDFVPRWAFTLCKALVEKGQGFTEAIDVARFGMNLDDIDLRTLAVALWEALFVALDKQIKDGKNFDVASNVVQEGMLCEDLYVQRLADNLQESLLKKRDESASESPSVSQVPATVKKNKFARFFRRLFGRNAQVVPD